MNFFYEFFPERAQRETLEMAIPEGAILPKGNYLFLESYCTNPDCHCDIAVIQIEQKPIDNEDHKRPLAPMAVLEYFYKKPLSANNPAIFQDAPRTPWTKAGQKLLREYLESHPDYRKSLGEHYVAMREEAKRLWYLTRPQPIKKEVYTNRNDPCPCGSGKKFKKCCLEKGDNILL